MTVNHLSMMSGSLLMRTAKMGIWESLFWYVLGCTVVGLFLGKFIGFGMGSDDEQR